MGTVLDVPPVEREMTDRMRRAGMPLPGPGWVVFWSAPVVLAVLSLFVGASSLSLAAVLSLDGQAIELLLVSRLPRMVSLVLAGMSLGVAGLITQQLAQNRFASPMTMGTDDAARLGVLLAILLLPGATTFVKMLFAFCCALLGTAAFLALVQRVRNRGSLFVPIVGLMYGNLLAAVTTFAAYKYDLVQNVSAWLQGNFALVIAGRYELLYLVVPLVAIAYLYAYRFTVAGFGEEIATTLGLGYRQTVALGLSIVSLVAAVVLVTVGTIPFLSLVVPNLAVLLRGDHLRRTLPLTAVLGTTFVLACDILGRVVIHPYEVPISVVAGVLGSAVFLGFLLVHGRRREGR